MTFFNDLVEIHTAPIAEGVYTRHRDWDNAKLAWSGLATVQPDRSFEVRSPERDTSQERLLVYLPWGVPVDSTDRVFYADEWFEVDGEPMRWAHGSLRHVRIRAWRAMH
ncbi:hypothetical protein [Streptomyces sp. NPDC048644]|uniref:hypothetical protein n=1 Tax=Streptomyces sp. NPDC048644 TaxID=3365582 RepID=UPI0037160C55